MGRICFYITAELAAFKSKHISVEAVFRQMGKTNLKYIEYDGLDHSWSDASGNSQVSIVLKDVIDLLFK